MQMQVSKGRGYHNQMHVYQTNLLKFVFSKLQTKGVFVDLSRDKYGLN